MFPTWRGYSSKNNFIEKGFPFGSSLGYPTDANDSVGYH